MKRLDTLRPIYKRAIVLLIIQHGISSGAKATERQQNICDRVWMRKKNNNRKMFVNWMDRGNWCIKENRHILIRNEANTIHGPHLQQCMCLSVGNLFETHVQSDLHVSWLMPQYVWTITKYIHCYFTTKNRRVDKSLWCQKSAINAIFW